MSFFKRVPQTLAAVVFGVVVVFVAWLLLQVFHESGHLFHGLISGAAVDRVTLDLMGFSFTSFKYNPHPAFVAWGGPIWGALLPVFIWIMTAFLRGRFRAWLKGFAGFCLIANGAYLAAGGPMRVGDAGDLLRSGVPLIVLIMLGTAMAVAGMCMWHRLGSARIEPTKKN